MKNILIFGASGHGKVIIDIVEKEHIYNISGLIDDNKNLPVDFSGYRLLGTTDEIIHIIKKCNIYGGIVAIGDNWIRSKIVNKIREILPDFIFVNTIHPSAQIARNVTTGKGCVVMAGAVINSDTRTGDFCIINTGSSVDHDNIIEDYASIAPGVTTGGNVKIGSFSAVSLGASIIHGVTVGEHTVVGAGSTVLKDLPSYVVAYGTPAQVVRERHAGEKYL
ncbi:MAG: acetyltransferase [Candidatus Eremiobacterota bacterium]